MISKVVGIVSKLLTTSAIDKDAELAVYGRLEPSDVLIDEKRTLLAFLCISCSKENLLVEVSQLVF